MKITIKHIVRNNGLSFPVMFTADVRMVNPSIGFFEYGGRTIWDEQKPYIEIEDIEYDEHMFTHEEIEAIEKEIEKGTVDKQLISEFISILESQSNL